MDKLKIFGTDGIRGLANKHPITAELALKLGMILGSKFKTPNGINRVVIGKDTRLSGYLLEPAFTAGFVSVGMDVILVGPVPTPGISILTKSMRCNLGLMLSASHNSFEDNGIKIFNSEGFKLSEIEEMEIESLLSSKTENLRAEAHKLGRAERLDDGTGVVRYIEFVKSTFSPKLSLKGLKIVLDCANGAGYKVAPRIFTELGADVIAIGVSPNGININDSCGSQFPDKMISLVKSERADFGIALDGDADRIICCDETGNVVNGDQILAVIANRWKCKGLLSSNHIVATIMSNTGLEEYLKSLDLCLDRTQVGDRHVVKKMIDLDSNLGGEQSGHIILGSFSYTGDGVLVALQLLSEIVEKNKPASDLLNMFTPLPQIIENVPLTSVEGFDEIINSKDVLDVIKSSKSALMGKGRINIRTSGTETLARIMIEGEGEEKIKNLVKDIKNSILKKQN